MDESQSHHHKSSIWHWVLLSIAIMLTIVWLFVTPDGILGKADAVGYAVCHRIPERSFQIGDRSFPMCARCSGLFLGALLGLIFQLAQGRKGKMPSKAAMVFFGLLAIAWVLDGVNSFLILMPSISTPYRTQNWTRLVTGTGMGLAVSVILYPSFIQTMFSQWQDASGVDTWKQVLLLLIAAVGLDGLILLEISWILYPLALLSALGVLILLTMVYSMVFVMITKKENAYQHLNQLLIPLLAGYCLALVQIGVIDLLRYLWTGTWGGFNLL